MPNKKLDPLEEFPKVEKILYQLAWDCARSTRLTFEEAKSEAYYAFMKCCESYDPTRKAKFSTWVHFKVRMHLKTYVTKLANSRLIYTGIKDERTGAAPAMRSEALELWDDLSRDAKELVSLVLETPQDFLASCPVTPSELLDRAKEHLGFNKGLDLVELEILVVEIQARFQEVWNPVKNIRA